MEGYQASSSSALGYNQDTPNTPEVHTHLCSQECTDKLESYRIHNAALIREDIGIKYKNDEYRKADKIYTTRIKPHREDLTNLNLKLFKSNLLVESQEKRIVELNAKVETPELELSQR